MHLQNFPMDVQICNLELESCKFSLDVIISIAVFSSSSGFFNGSYTLLWPSLSVIKITGTQYIFTIHLNYFTVVKAELYFRVFK